MEKILEQNLSATFPVYTLNSFPFNSDSCFVFHFVSSIAEFTVAIFVMLSSISYVMHGLGYTFFVLCFTCLLPVDQ